jgi:hypothetical protein
MIFHTISGSTYEVNKSEKKIRRLNGITDPTPRMGEDGKWKNYLKLYPDHPQVGQSVLIVWGNDVDLMPETKEALERGEIDVALKVTTTSPIRSIVDEVLLS